MNEHSAKKNNLGFPEISDMGTIMKDMYSVAYSSENYTWFIEKDEVKDYTDDEWKEFLKDLEVLDSLDEDMMCIIECPRDLESILENKDDPAVTFYGAFFDMFNHNQEKKDMEDLLGFEK